MEDSRKKTYIADIERGVYDIKDEMHHKFTTGKGLTEEIVRKISEKKNEPQWMLEYRLKALEVFNSKPVPTWRLGYKRYSALSGTGCKSDERQLG